MSTVLFSIAAKMRGRFAHLTLSCAANAGLEAGISGLQLMDLRYQYHYLMAHRSVRWNDKFFWYRFSLVSVAVANVLFAL